MSHEQNTRTLEKMLELAQFGADGHRERRQVEFRVFISYITVLVIGLYQVNKPEDSILQNIPEEKKLLLLSLSVFVLSLIHYLYCFWQRNISIALINDVRRRDFYLQKAQCLSYHLSQRPCAAFKPSRTKKIWLNEGGGRSSKPISELYLFNKQEPKIIKETSWSEFWKISYDWHIWFQIGVPTLILISLIVTVFTGHLLFQFVASMLPLLLLVITAVARLCEYLSLIYRKRNRYRK